MAGEAEAAEPTELAGVAEMGTESVAAWSLAEDYPETGSWGDPERRLSPKRITLLSVLASVVAVGAVGGFAAWKLRDHQVIDRTVVVVATETVTTVVPAPAPTPSSTVVHVAAPSAMPMKPPSTPDAAYDQTFIANLKARSWVIDDVASVLHQARLVCTVLRQGASVTDVENDMMNGSPPATPVEAESFVAAAMATYPNCS
ncbi:DUF732 domain-containing protein [Mycolicibacterium sphagni]|uniref:DUF732 domain-containing protein n=1 Tax=Mycolicibacterium sphagni TaxID=1786 RepID=UPI0021F32492|nr:DUF732 domain-containing protein [Mycolicibacterium sphagni]MCV7176755.1 DUF732 domain-containing protein [Mycolicibacterium sphagni]